MVRCGGAEKVCLDGRGEEKEEELREETCERGGEEEMGGARSKKGKNKETKV